MNYMILIYRNPQSRQIFESFTDEQRAAGLQVYTKLRDELADSGELVVTHALADASLGKRIAVREGQTVATDGPFAEAKEELAGFFLVDCASPERAVEIAARIPEARLGLIEVRPTMVYREMES
jgi:hypothetical protein